MDGTLCTAELWGLDNGLESTIRVDKLHKAVLSSTTMSSRYPLSRGERVSERTGKRRHTERITTMRGEKRERERGGRKERGKKRGRGGGRTSRKIRIFEFFVLDSVGFRPIG